MTAARVVSLSRIAVRFMLVGAFNTADALITRVERDAKEVTEKEPAARAFSLSARVSRALWLGDIEPAAMLAQEAVACFDLVGDLSLPPINGPRAGLHGSAGDEPPVEKLANEFYAVVFVGDCREHDYGIGMRQP
jgi:ParB-like chromosome segregation protein Spo0J